MGFREEPGELVPGASFAARYRVEHALGSGAGGHVYAALDERTGARVALKVRRVRKGERAAQLGAQFEREYHTLCQLSHPSIIEVHDYGVDGDDAYYTMELLDGQDLRAAGRLPPREVCVLLRDVASALSVLHARRLLHRDLSAHNVRRTSDGRARLIDFGAMATIGVSTLLVGTPPFVPPEALALQALDGRSDLYALGALGYLLLTGRHAYRARTFRELRDLWRSPPKLVRELAKDAPEPLERLVHQLLQLDRTARPATAAEVMERLSAIAGLPADEAQEVSRAYLTTPMLIGRDALVQDARALLLTTARGSGGALVIEGARGTGRSRALDACVLEAKLLGATVLRADLADGLSGDYGVARALLRQLDAELPEVLARHAAPHRALLDALQGAGAGGSGAEDPLRRSRQIVLRDLVLAIARERVLVLAVDDVDSVDEPSVALLAALADAASRRRLAVIVSCEPDAPEGAAHADTGARRALRLIRRAAQRYPLTPLDQAQTEALLRSVFGDAPNLAPIAERVHALSEGRPRAITSLAEHLLLRGVARYQSGRFTLPTKLGPEDLPDSLLSAIATRLDALSPDARTLAEALSLTHAAALPLDRYPTLVDEADPGRGFRALGELFSQDVLDPAGERARFTDPELARHLRDSLPEARLRVLHERLARAVETADEPVLVPHHLLLAGRVHEAVERLIPLRTDERSGYSELKLTLLRRALAEAERLALPLRVQIELRVWLVANLGYFGRYDDFAHYAPPLLELLEQASGITDLGALDASIPPKERLERALGAAQARYQARSEAERGVSPIEAIVLLSRLCGTCVSLSSVMQEPALVKRLPSLEPFFVLSPAIEVVQRLIHGMIAFQAGRYDETAAIYQSVLRRVEEPDRAGLDPAYYKTLRQGVLQLLGVLSAARGQDTVHALTFDLGSEPGMRVNAERVRMTYQLMQGDLEAAAMHERRAELLLLRDGGQLPYPGSTLRIELLAHLYCESPEGLRHVLDQIEPLSAVCPRWIVTAELGRALHRGLLGDRQGSLEGLERVLEELRPGEHLDWGVAVSCRVAMLILLDRADEAADDGLEYLEVCLAERLHPTHRMLMRVVADALVTAGRADHALAIAERCVAEHLANGAHGMILGMAYETRARVALALGDAEGFRTYAERCGLEYRLRRNPVLSAKYQRLVDEARARGVAPPAMLQRLVEPATAIDPADAGGAAAAGQAARRLQAAGSAAEREREALAILVESTTAEAGWLFGMRDGRLTLLTGSTHEPPPPELAEALSTHLRASVAALDTETAAASVWQGAAAAAAKVELLADGHGRTLRPLLLEGARSGERVVAAVAALRGDAAAQAPVEVEVLEAIADALLEQDALDAVTCVA